jgi:amphi-Trp domain-containing protein
MGKEVVLFASEERHDLASVAEFLREFASKLEENKVVFRRGDDELALDIPQNVTFEIKVEEETGSNKTERSIELEIEWKVGEESQGKVSLG